MAHYVLLFKFTEQGIRNVKDTAKRAKGFEDLAKSMGVTVHNILWTLGRYDGVLILEAQNDEGMASLMMKVGSLGNLKTETLRAFDRREIEPILSKI